MKDSRPIPIVPRRWFNPRLPVLYVELPEECPDYPLLFDEFDLLKRSASLLGRAERDLLLCRFRGVSLDRLPTVFSNGVDVVPSDAPIYADFFEKAWEYGGLPKLILALDIGGLEKTYLEVPANTEAEELARLRRLYPTTLRSQDGTTLWLSRLDADDTRISTPYECAYAYWIPGDPFLVLKAVFLFARPSDQPEAFLSATLKD